MVYAESVCLRRRHAVDSAMVIEVLLLRTVLITLSLCAEGRSVQVKQGNHKQDGQGTADSPTPPNAHNRSSYRCSTVHWTLLSTLTRSRLATAGVTEDLEDPKAV